jgi:hypothetical protein
MQQECLVYWRFYANIKLIKSNGCLTEKINDDVERVDDQLKYDK